MEVWHPGMPPREEALATLKELDRTPPSGRRERLRRIPVAALVVLAALALAVVVGWIIARAR